MDDKTLAVAAVEEKSPAARFAESIDAEIASLPTGMQFNDKQREIAAAYFLAIDAAITTAEQRRLSDNEWKSTKNDLPYTWKTIDFEPLKLAVINNARLGLDSRIANHISPVMYKSGKTGRYAVTLMRGYVGMALVAKKYALYPITSTTIELVYSTDTFKILKKNAEREKDAYLFEITNPFDRGELLGGFCYLEFKDPLMNKLIFLSIREILKRKPTYASPEFWGGTKKQKNKKTGNLEEIQIEGWLEEMAWKTIARHAFGGKYVEIDPEKVDSAYTSAQEDFIEAAYTEVESEAHLKAATIPAELPPPAAPALQETPPEAAAPPEEAEEGVAEVEDELP